MPQRARQILLVGSLLWLSWLTMMLVHESGHVLGARCTGGKVCQVVWHPAVISRTDVRPNPHPLVEVWAGPLIGSLLPLAVAGVASAARRRIGYLLWVGAGFCLIANGAYIGVGAIHPVGDAAELVLLGTPRWVMAGFGLVAVVAGLWIWDGVSSKLGFGRDPVPVSAKHSYATFAVAVVLTAVALALGNRGM